MTVANRLASAVDVGPGLLFIAKLGTTEPAGIVDATWGAAWVELGYTDNGSVFKIDPTVDDVRVAEETDPVQTITSSVNSTLTVEMAQLTAWNLAVAMGGGTIATPTGYVTFEPPAAGTETAVMLGWRSAAEDEAMLWRKCKASGALNLERRAGSTKATLPVEFKVLAPGGTTKSWMWYGATARTGADLTLVY